MSSVFYSPLQSGSPILAKGEERVFTSHALPPLASPPGSRTHRSQLACEEQEQGAFPHTIRAHNADCKKQERWSKKSQTLSLWLLPHPNPLTS